MLNVALVVGLRRLLVGQGRGPLQEEVHGALICLVVVPTEVAPAAAGLVLYALLLLQANRLLEAVNRL